MTDTLWIHYVRPRPHWYALDEATKSENLDAWKAVRAASEAKSATFVGRYHVRGQHDYESVEIWRFADAEAAFDHWAALTAAGYGELNAFLNNIGLSEEAPR